MALVNYSDSESESEAPPPAPKPPPAKPAFQKVPDRSTHGVIKVDLPSLQADPGHSNGDEPPSKRVRTGGVFSGFNSLLPPPKRRAQSSLKPGLSLKTSGEAAFIRESPNVGDENVPKNTQVNDNHLDGAAVRTPAVSVEPKLVGKATRFVPLSVANRKKKQPRPPQEKAVLSQGSSAPENSFPAIAPAKEITQSIALETRQPESKQKHSLFIAPQEEQELIPPENSTDIYEPLLEAKFSSTAASSTDHQTDSPPLYQDANPSSLETMASDLNLTAAQRRQLFGRNAKDANIAHFNMETEYAANEELRKAGEVVQRRAVRAIAPGKHSLQQLVNNARSQKDALEDAWAEGRKNRGEGGSKYGWS